MSVEDSQQAFHDLYTAVFKNEKDSPEIRALRLDEELKKLLVAHRIPHTARMSDFSASGSCTVPNPSVGHTHHPDIRLRSWRTARGGHTDFLIDTLKPNPSIQQAFGAFVDV